MIKGRTAGAFLTVIGIVTIIAVFAFRPSGAESVTGLVVDVQGGIETVETFTLRTGDGDLLEFVPADGVDFDGGPIGHVRDHLRSLEPVAVTYEERDGVLVATAVRDD